MSFFTKSLFINPVFKRFSTSLYSLNELRLNYAHYYTCSNKAKSFLSSSPHPTDFKISLIPERTFMNSYTVEVIKSKVADAYDTVIHFGRGQERLLGFKWFKTLDDLKSEEFLRLLELEDSFYSWFKIIELHTWMLLLILPQRTKGHRAVRLGLINAFWVDVEIRCHILAPENKDFKKNMRTLYERFQVSLYLYDDAYFNHDRDLTSALWYNMYDKANVDPRLLEVLVSYIRHQTYHLHQLGIMPERVEDANLKLWTPLAPHYDLIFKQS